MFEDVEPFLQIPAKSIGGSGWLTRNSQAYIISSNFFFDACFDEVDQRSDMYTVFRKANFHEGIRRVI